MELKYLTVFLGSSTKFFGDYFWELYTVLLQHRQYTKPPSTTSTPPRTVRTQDTKQPRREGTHASLTGPRTCYNCSKSGHFAMKCPHSQQESRGRVTMPAKTKCAVRLARAVDKTLPRSPNPKSSCNQHQMKTPLSRLRVYVSPTREASHCV